MNNYECVKLTILAVRSPVTTVTNTIRSTIPYFNLVDYVNSVVIPGGRGTERNCSLYGNNLQMMFFRTHDFPNKNRLPPHYQPLHIFAFEEGKQEAALSPSSWWLALLRNLRPRFARADLPVHVIHSICCEVETLDLGVTRFESTRETRGNRGSYFLLADMHT